MAGYIEQIEKRRTFAIISHPDAGKTTLTEKFLLYGGANRRITREHIDRVLSDFGPGDALALQNETSELPYLAERARDINPDCCTEVFRMFYLPQNADQVDLSQYDYVIDCIDTVTAKLELVTRCSALRVKLISAMGTALPKW